MLRTLQTFSQMYVYNWDYCKKCYSAYTIEIKTYYKMCYSHLKGSIVPLMWHLMDFYIYNTRTDFMPLADS